MKTNPMKVGNLSKNTTTTYLSRVSGFFEVKLKKLDPPHRTQGIKYHKHVSPNNQQLY